LTFECDALKVFSAHKSGTKAKKINKGNPYVGQLQANKSPETSESNNGFW
jgi:hypothetical protein